MLVRKVIGGFFQGGIFWKGSFMDTDFRFVKKSKYFLQIWQKDSAQNYHAVVWMPGKKKPQKHLWPFERASYFGHFPTLHFQFFFDLKKPTFRPQNFILFLDHFLHALSTPTICPYLTKVFWSQNIWYFDG